MSTLEAACAPMAKKRAVRATADFMARDKSSASGESGDCTKMLLGQTFICRTRTPFSSFKPSGAIIRSLTYILK